jgi:hypothetical protein
MCDKIPCPLTLLQKRLPCDRGLNENFQIPPDLVVKFQPVDRIDDYKSTDRKIKALLAHPARRSSPMGVAIAPWSAAWTRTAGWGRGARRDVLRGEGLGTGELGRLGGDFRDFNNSSCSLWMPSLWRAIFTFSPSTPPPSRVRISPVGLNPMPACIPNTQGTAPSKAH